jgi:hypothetical protein
VDSKDVDRRLKALVWDRLRGLGFTERKGRTAWRRRQHTIDVVNIQSFNSYLAEAIGATTYSFAVNLGVAFPSSRQYPWQTHPVAAFPREYECAARRRPRKGIAQRIAGNSDRFLRRSTDRDRPDTWFVALDGSNLDELVEDAWQQIVSQGLPWFDELSELKQAIEIFAARPDTDLAPGIVGDSYAGAPGSPNRTETMLTLAMELGDSRRALLVLRDFISISKPPLKPWQLEYLDKVRAWEAWLLSRA